MIVIANCCFLIQRIQALMPINSLFKNLNSHEYSHSYRRINSFSVIFCLLAKLLSPKINNFYNMHVLADENPHAILE